MRTAVLCDSQSPELQEDINPKGPRRYAVYTLKIQSYLC